MNDDIVAAVREAWADTARPASENIAPHPCDECDDIRKYLEMRDPFDFDDEAVRGCVWDLPLLSAEAKRFYLPVWLIASLRDPQGSDATDALVYALDTDHRWDPEGGYTPAQRALVAQYLETMVEAFDDPSDFFWPFLQRSLERWADWPRPADD